MKSTALPDAQNRFSTSLAKDIGLEPAVMLCTLVDASRTASGQDFKGFRWFLIDKPQLSSLFPFWSDQDIQRIINQLQDLQYLFIDGAPYTQTQRLHFAFNHNAQAQQHTEPQDYSQRSKAHILSLQWQPDKETVIQLQQFKGVNRQFIQNYVKEFVLTAREKNQPRDDWNAEFRKKVSQQWERSRANTHFAVNTLSEPQAICANWQPSADAQEMLDTAAINREFYQPLIPEFILFWQSKGAIKNSWDFDFVQYVKKQWAQQLAIVEHNATPHIIAADWQPSFEVLEMLNLANIPEEFAEAKIQEFILYWKERAELNNNWNYKFVQHIKYLWAKQHEGQQSTDQKRTAEQDFVELHTDSSWADEL